MGEPQDSSSRHGTERTSSETRYWLLIEKAGDPIFVLDASTLRLVEANAKGRALLSLGPSDAAGRDFLEFVAPGHRETLRAALRDLPQRGPEVLPRIPILTSQQVYRPFDLTVVGINLQGRGVAQLIARQRRTVITKAVPPPPEHDFYRRLVEASTDVFFALDLEGIVRYISPSARTTLGFAIEDICGKSYTAFVDAEDLELATRSFHRAMEGPVTTPILRIRHKDGPPRRCIVNAAPLLDESDETVQVSGSIQDMTNYLEAQERIRQLEKLATAGEAVAHIVHEIRNPLQSIASAVQNIEMEEGPTDPGLLRVIREETRRLGRLLQNLLRLTRPPRLNPVPTDIVELIDESLMLLEQEIREQAQIQIQRDFSANLGAVQLDADLVRQALWNLYRNAVEAMDQGGTIRVRAYPTRHLQQDAVAIEVSDSGGGVSPEFQEKAFDPFTSSKKSGTGLGLAVVRQVAIAHGGDAGFVPDAEHGCSILLVLPLRGPG